MVFATANGSRTGKAVRSQEGAGGQAAGLSSIWLRSSEPEEPELSSKVVVV